MTSVDGPGPAQDTNPTSVGLAPSGATPAGGGTTAADAPSPAVDGTAGAGGWAGGGTSGAVPPGSWSAGPPVAWQPAEPDRITRFVLRLHARSPRWAVPLAALGCVAAGMAYALVSDPTTSDPDAAPSCLLKLVTGLDCPGCGGTRALWYVLHGDLPAAARHHFLFVFALPFLAYLFVAWAGRQAFGWRLPELRLSSPVIGGFLAVWLAFSVLRNLPWAPFTALYV
ncbi:DUF2752 domain-containing protein [Micromonospora sp. NPDC092111]|uniref:DUF2752 domain-containing protein n=1 Tax=Micromonospora sp. NPDC092111 TaxID=3364289 RepID=UPI00381C932D